MDVKKKERDIIVDTIQDGTLADDEQTDHSPGSKLMINPSDNMATPELNSSADCIKDCSTDPENCDSRGKSRRNRRKGKGGKHHHKKWKPYTKLTWDERKAMDERESIRANQRREERFSLGQPMAPYNTTQFLMEQHPAEQLEPQFKEQQMTNMARFGYPRSAPIHSISRTSGEVSGSLDSSDEYYSSPDDEEIFLQKEFSEAYDNFHAERIQTMTKDELVREYLELEIKVTKLEKQNVPSSRSSSRESQEENMDTSNASKYEEEIRKLKAENERLRKENEVLQAGVLNNVNFDNKENTP